jgi:hypothetical protein
LVALDEVSTHALPQAMSPDRHPQAPSVHSSPERQVFPHSPQCSTLVVWSAQRPSQAAVPSGQLQLPSAQAWPSAHDSPHTPQFSGSSLTIVHAPLHDSSPDGQLPHSPVEQLVPRAHASPQRPQ